MTTIALLQDAAIAACRLNGQNWIANEIPYYANLLCLKPTKQKKDSEMDTVRAAHRQITQWVTETEDDMVSAKVASCCVLPKGHTGVCTAKFHSALFNHPTLIGKFDWLYTTPGDDDYIYKNRAPRTFPIVVPGHLESTWRDKTTKRRCAIPLREASRPEMIAAAFLDYLTLALSTHGIGAYINQEHKHLAAILETVAVHKPHLVNYYGSLGRKVVDADGFAVCPVLGTPIHADQLANNNLKDPTAIQLGHVQPRTESAYTIRGKNILMMTRRGNLLVGDCDFTSDAWLDDLGKVVRFHQPT
jgi:hypothetical protein